MDKNNINNYQKFILVLSILYKKSSENSPLSSYQINDKLKERYNTFISPRTVENMINSFNSSQNEYDIKIIKSNPIKYYFSSFPSLDFGEAKAIIDLVYSSKFFSEKVKNNFILRMKESFNEEDKKMLDKNIESHTVGNENDDSFFKSFEDISRSISLKRKISFKYSKKQPNKIDLKIKEYHDLWPIETNCENNTFYVYCYDEKESIVKSFRIDFINDVQMKKNYPESEMINDKVRNLIMNSTFGYSPERYAVLEITFENDLYTNIIDKFGRNISNLKYVDDKHYSFTNICPISHTFYSWIISFGGAVKITSPEEEVLKFKDFLKSNFL